jgi:hypothetical protein
MQDGFPIRVRISESTSAIRTEFDHASGREGVKGRDERQSTAPLTPSRPPREVVCAFQLTGGQAVIHGAHAVIANTCVKNSGGWSAGTRNGTPKSPHHPNVCPIHRGFIAMSGSRSRAVHSDSISTTPRTPIGAGPPQSVSTTQPVHKMSLRQRLRLFRLSSFRLTAQNEYGRPRPFGAARGPPLLCRVLIGGMGSELGQNVSDNLLVHGI